MGKYEQLINDFKKKEDEIVGKVTEEVHELIEEKHRLQAKIKELENQEIHDDNGTSNALELMKAKEDLEKTNNELDSLLQKDINDPKDSLINHINDFQN